MPATLIEIRRRIPAEDEVALIEAVQAALVEALKIPETDRTVRLIVHEPHRFAIDPSRDDRFTLITAISSRGARSMPRARSMRRSCAIWEPWIFPRIT